MTGSEKSREHEDPTPSAPSIYVTSLIDYVAGRLVGRWIGVDDPDQVHAEISEMLRSSPTPGAEEWAIHDYDGFGPISIGEYESVERLCAVADGIRAHGPAFAHWVTDTGVETEAFDQFEDHYLGGWPSLRTFVESLIEESGVEQTLDEMNLPFGNYVRVDVDALARDIEIELQVAVDAEGTVHLFQPP